MNDLAESACIDVAAAHPAIAHVLSAFDASAAGAASRAIAEALAERLACEDPWVGSRLTGDGFPCEFAFSTADARVRFTVEPGARTLAPRERLDVAVHVLERLGHPPISRATITALRDMQASGELAYGAWIGGRAGPLGFTGKIYVEVPRGAALRSRSLAALARAASPRMIAFMPASAAFEAYLRIGTLSPAALPAVLAPVGGERHARAVHEFVEDVHGRRIHDRYPGHIGVSYDWPRAERLTMYFYAGALWGPDAAIRRGFSRAARMLGADDAPYLHATQPMAERDTWKTSHGLFGVTLDAAGGLSAAIGIRPLAP